MSHVSTATCQQTSEAARAARPVRKIAKIAPGSRRRGSRRQSSQAIRPIGSGLAPGGTTTPLTAGCDRRCENEISRIRKRVSGVTLMNTQTHARATGLAISCSC